MKKIKVCDLAKSKKISSKEMIKLLEAKGLKKVRAITYVDPSILDDAPAKKVVKPKVTPKTKSAKGNVSNIFSAPSRGGAATAEVLEEKKESSPEKLIEQREKKEAVAKKEASLKKEAELKKKKEEEKAKRLVAALKRPKVSEKKPSYHAMLVASLALILGLFGVWKIENLTSRVATDQKLLASLDSKIGELSASLNGNSAEIATIKDDVAGLSTKVANAEVVALESQLKSEATILRGLSGSLKDPLKSRAINLANDISTF